MATKSVIQSEKRCFICGAVDGLEEHHCLFGNARKKCEADGLKVWLCWKCHRNLHEKGVGMLVLKMLAEAVWIVYHNSTVEGFIKRYGKNYL